MKKNDLWHLFLLSVLTGLFLAILVIPVAFKPERNSIFVNAAALEPISKIVEDGLSADSTIKPAESAIVDSSWWYRIAENNAFGVGERLVFSVKYGMLPAGSAVIEIPEIVKYENKECYRVVSAAESNDVISVFYKVRDSVETLIDANGIFARRFWKHLREGGYKVDKTTFFDQRNHLAITENDTIPTYSFVQDALSSLYYVRTQEFEIGKPILIDNHTDRKNYPLQINVLRKEKIEVSAGKFDCYVIEPVMRAEGIFRAKGRIWIWISDDQYKIPVQMKTEVFFLGSISAQLSSYSLGKIEDQLE